jgi:plastocyanin
MKFSLAPVAALAIILAAGTATAKDYSLTLKDNAFEPANLEVAAGEKIKLTVKNETDKAAEFESDDLDREKVVAAHSSIVVEFDALKPGTYEFDNDFHEATKGTITAK